MELVQIFIGFPLIGTPPEPDYIHHNLCMNIVRWLKQAIQIIEFQHRENYAKQLASQVRVQGLTKKNIHWCIVNSHACNLVMNVEIVDKWIPVSIFMIQAQVTASSIWCPCQLLASSCSAVWPSRLHQKEARDSLSAIGTHDIKLDS